MIISNFREHYVANAKIREKYFGFDNKVQSRLLDDYPNLIKLSKNNYQKKLSLEAYYIWKIFLSDYDKKNFKMYIKSLNQ